MLCVYMYMRTYAIHVMNCLLSEPTNMSNFVPTLLTHDYYSCAAHINYHVYSGTHVHHILHIPRVHVTAPMFVRGQQFAAILKSHAVILCVCLDKFHT